MHNKDGQDWYVIDTFFPVLRDRPRKPTPSPPWDTSAESSPSPPTARKDAARRARGDVRADGGGVRVLRFACVFSTSANDLRYTVSLRIE